MSLPELFAKLDQLLKPYDPAGEWPWLVELEAQSLVAKIERLQGYVLYK